MKLNGKPLMLRPATPVVERLIKHLEQMPDDEVTDSEALLAKGLVGRDTLIRAAKNNSQFEPYRVLAPGGAGHVRYLYGNPRAIKALKKLIEAQS